MGKIIYFYKTAAGSYVLTETKGKNEFVSRDVLLGGIAVGANAYFRVNPNSLDRYDYLNREVLLADVRKESGVAYTDVELNAVFADFFLSAASSGGGSGASGGADLKSFTVELTRPADTTVYTAGDVVGDVTGVLKEILAVAKAAGKGVRIYRVRIQTSDTGVTAGSKFNVHLYNEVPDVTGLADNAAFSTTYANATKRVGKVPVVMDSSVGANDYTCIGLNPVGTSVYAILETVTGFTPSANSTKFQITIDCELSNN